MTIFIVTGLLISMGILSFFLTSRIIRYSTRNNILVIPNKRSLHDHPTPTGGGIAITISWYLGISVLYFLGIIERTLYFALLSGIIITVVSIIDDLRDLKPAIRLIFHFAAALTAFIFLKGLRSLVIPGIEFNYNYVVYPLTIIGMVWFINLFNFMDGVDGLASVEIITICSVLFVVSWNIINILLISCITGFLCWNWPKARIFMGDVGSTQLGFITVVFGIYYHNSFDFSILNWIMLTSPFWFDATFTLFRRWGNGEKLSQAHCKHAYQRIVHAGFSHEKVNISFILINLFIILLVILYRGIKILQIPLFALSLAFLYLITKQVDRRVPFGKRKE